MNKEQEKTKVPNLIPRQWALYRLIRHYSLRTSVKRLPNSERFATYCPNITLGTMTSKLTTTALWIWSDIKNLNLSYEIDKIVISENFEYWLGDKTQTDDFINGLWDDLFPRLSRYWATRRKVARNGQREVAKRPIKANR